LQRDASSYGHDEQPAAMKTPWRPDHDVIIFDCDGVLLDSNLLKIDAFRKTLELNGFAPEVVAAGSLWQTKSFGLSRYRLFAEMLDGRFGKPPEVGLEKLLDDFGLLCASGYLSVPCLRSYNMQNFT
jgi:hypothetical protein